MSDDGRIPVSIDCATLLAHLREGSFTAASPAFLTDAADDVPDVVQLQLAGCFADHPEALAEALTCAAFLGAMEPLEYLLGIGVSPDGGAATGLNALHWAANRGELTAVLRLLRAGAALEAQNSYGGTVLGAAVWASVHEAKPEHAAIIKALLQAGADVREAAFPCGDPDIDALLSRYGGHQSGS